MSSRKRDQSDIWKHFDKLPRHKCCQVAMEQSSQTHTNKSITKIYNTQAQLDKHLQSHHLLTEYMQSAHVNLERVNIFGCEICTRGFLDRNDLKNHQKKYYEFEINTKLEDNNNQLEKPYKCDECGVRFVRETTLVAHSVTHEPFPHVCQCGVGYYRKCDLDSHRRLVHPIFNHQNKIPKVKQEFAVNSKPRYKTDSEADDAEEPEQSDDDNYKPKSKVGPRLKAKLTYKPKGKSRNKRTHKNKENMVVKDESGQYKCPICAKTYLSRHGIKEHMTDHTGEKYKCDECLQELPSMARLIQHKRSHAGVKHFECRVCNKQFGAKKNLEIHMRTHTGEKPYACNLCPMRFTQGGALKHHVLRHKGEKNHECEQCGKRFLLADNLVRHRRVHTGEKPFECETCGKCFADPSAFRRHKLIHTGLKPHKCEVCAKAFCDYSALFRHRLIHQGYSVKCTVCDRTFKARDQMLRHIKLTHKPIKEEEKCECDHCGKKFMFKQYLVIHMQLMHLKIQVPKVKCDICGKMETSRTINRHIQHVHLGALTCECEVCGQVIPSKYRLKSHMRVHDKVKENIYECDHCHASYSYKSAVAKHIVFKHLGIKCDLCKKSFPTSHKLRLHRSTGCEKCPVCHMAFRTKTLMEHHFVRHVPRNQRQVFECDYCCKQFPLKSRLLKHIKYVHELVKAVLSCDHCKETFCNRNKMRDHIWDKHMISLYCDVCLKRFYNEREFKLHKRARCELSRLPCDICELTFRKPSHLQVHLLSHGPKRLQCDLCGVRYKTKPCMIRHMRSAHGFK